MKWHIDLFSGIGGFSLAADNVWGKGNIKHIFCDNDPFCQQVLKKHWPETKIYGDIRTLTYANIWASRPRNESESVEKTYAESGSKNTAYLLTGGFPCQPFSQAGRRKGTEDDRYLWPEMFRVIREFRPEWVVAENVAGLVTWNEGLVLEQVCADLEGEGYEVQPFIIPAVAVNAPHRRDRVWIIAHGNDTGSGAPTSGIIKDRTQNSQERKHTQRGTSGRSTTYPIGARAGSKSGAIANERGRTSEDRRESIRQAHGTVGASRIASANSDAPDTEEQGLEGRSGGRKGELVSDTRYNRGTSEKWNENWLEVATRLCRVDDGVRNWVDGRGKIRNSRNPRLKALGNAIVPQVAAEIMRAIKSVDDML